MARKKGLSFYQKKKRISSELIRDIVEVLVGSIAAIFLAAVIVFAFGMRTSIIGDSMEESLFNSQEIFINRVVYKLSSPKRGDVITFLPNGNKNTHYYVKRVVGLPGETVQIKDGFVFIDGNMYYEDDKYDKIADAGIAENELVLENDEYFVLGDNRNSSEDSRSGNIGPIKKDTIIGKAWFHMGYGMNQPGFIK